jgi:hypothetical protein
VLVETVAPVPDLTIPAGTYSARQLLDKGVQQLRGYEWKDEGGVAHLYQRALRASRGNLLNVQIRRFSFPANVADFDFYFRPCISGTIQGYDCTGGGAYTGFKPSGLEKEPLPSLEAFKDVQARAILLRALQANGHFYVLIAYESAHPRLRSNFPFGNWFTRTLVPAEPLPMWIQRPEHKAEPR